MNKYEGIGISAIKYAVLNLILIFNNLLLLASGPYGGGTGDREEGLTFYTVHWFGLVFVFVIYGLFAITSGREKKRIRVFTALPVLVSSAGITGVIVYSLSEKKNMYQAGGLFNDLGEKVLNLNADFLTCLIYFFILFAVFISIVGMRSRNRFSLIALIMNLLLLCLHIYALQEWL
ncbi:hypothetical protein AMQ84_16220 [Paenibacillus riograndensis]|uniref:Uncharacterized protein n=1 Tax=Paenibacillus riograndensis TaxID=483937 RepID=A0A132TXA5_9BACL|nr:hypothetical protein [Paenibacillus riograndensis]KWX75900.1 hypothetical protein AMQ84_16220 [Paenibacillus riograndensis]